MSRDWVPPVAQSGEWMICFPSAAGDNCPPSSAVGSLKAEERKLGLDWERGGLGTLVAYRLYYGDWRGWMVGIEQKGCDRMEAHVSIFGLGGSRNTGISGGKEDGLGSYSYLYPEGNWNGEKRSFSTEEMHDAYEFTGWRTTNLTLWCPSRQFLNSNLINLS